jgi:hypothetical protein
MSRDPEPVETFEPDLSPEYSDRFDRLTDELLEYSDDLDREVAIKDETMSIENEVDEGEEIDLEDAKYLSALEVLLDLLEMGYDIEKESEFKIVRPDLEKYKQEPEKYKEHERTILQKERMVQFQDDSVREFIRDMEAEHGNTGSVCRLITDGEDLYSDIEHLQDKERDEIIDELDDIIQPYIQVADTGEKCPHTRLDLRDIWRYFRYTWLTPYNTVPGRNVNLIIRDAARENHPVMGIACLASSMMNLTDRDLYIGWTIDALEEELERKKQVHESEEMLPEDKRTPDQKTRTVEHTEWLETEKEYEERVDEFSSSMRDSLEGIMEEKLETIRYDDFIEEYDYLTEERILDPDDKVLEILEEIEEEASEKIDNDEATDPNEFDTWEERSETELFRKKRATNLREVLDRRRYFVENKDLDDREFLEQSVEDSQGKRALKTALKELKKRRVGAGMMNIMVCGAIPPYNHLVGGKLVAMAVTGPKPINEYKQKYEGYPSKIASSMKGEKVEKPNEVVFYDTTGLFEVGSAQYDRIRIPAQKGKMEYKELGYTSGYGSIQFGPDTRKRLAQVNKIVEGRRVVSGTFGEGIAPRMRKIRRGLKNTGLSGSLLKHDSKRIVYGVELAANAREYLLGQVDTPEYYWEFDDLEEEQQMVYDHWKERWASKRVQRDQVLDDIQEFARDEFILSSEIDEKQQQRISDFIVDS